MENELIEQRKQKVEELRKIGINPYSNDFKPDHEALRLLSSYSKLTEEELKKETKEFSLAGRVVALRDFGKSIFIHILDRTGKIQGYLRKDIVGEEDIKFFKKYIDIGDFIGIKGNLFKTKNRRTHYKR